MEPSCWPGSYCVIVLALEVIVKMVYIFSIDIIYPNSSASRVSSADNGLQVKVVL